MSWRAAAAEVTIERLVIIVLVARAVVAVVVWVRRRSVVDAIGNAHTPEAAVEKIGAGDTESNGLPPGTDTNGLHPDTDTNALCRNIATNAPRRDQESEATGVNAAAIEVDHVHTQGLAELAVARDRIHILDDETTVHGLAPGIVELKKPTAIADVAETTSPSNPK